jgi:serine/threonine protein kinase
MQCPRCDRKLSEDDRFCSRCGLARSLDGVPIDPLIGLTVSDRYRIEERIGVGGMGTVYRAQHIRFGQDVAIKVLHERYTGDEKLARRFEKEALTYGQVSHPNLVGLHDFGTTPDGMFFMALDYCPGQPLSTLLRQRRKFAWRAAAEIVMQVAQGLGAAHDCGVVHRDLKPENIIMTEIRPNRYHVRLLDFGIAKREDEDGPRLTQAGMVFGTPEYMSPEQARGKTVDKRSDIYALGTLFYELIVGSPPFHGGDKLRVMQQQANEPPVRPSEHEVGDLSPEIEELILKCLEKDPGERVQDTQFFLDQVEQIESRFGGDASVSEMSHSDWNQNDQVRTSSLGATLVGDTLNSEVVAASEDADTREHSPMSEGFYHQRITTQAKAYLPIMGAVVTILVIVIGGGLLVRGQSSEAVLDVPLAGESTAPSNPVSQAGLAPLTTTVVSAKAQPRTAKVETSVRASEKVKRGAPKRIAVDHQSAHKQTTTPTTPTTPTALERGIEQLEQAIVAKRVTQAQLQLSKVEKLQENSEEKMHLGAKLVSLRASVTKLSAARDAQIKKTIAKARRQLQSADFNQVEASLKKLKQLNAPEASYAKIGSKLHTARTALTQARQHYAKADCRRTMTSLKPIIAVTPRSKRVAKLVDACRQALPPQRL